MPVVEVAVGGVSFRAEEQRDARYGAFWAAFSSGGFEPATVELLRRRLGPGRTFLDGGAWIGPFTLLAASLGASVIAFEPDPCARAALEANLALNPSLIGRVEVRSEALAARSGRAQLDGSVVGLGNGRSQLSHLRLRLRRPDSATETPGGRPVGPVDAAIAEVELLDAGALDLSSVDVVKLDLEGAEYEVLPALAAALRRHRPLLLLSVHGGDPHRMTAPQRVVHRLRAAPSATRLLWPLRTYPSVARIDSNRSTGWRWLSPRQRVVLPFRLGEYELVAATSSEF